VLADVLTVAAVVAALLETTAALTVDPALPVPVDVAALVVPLVVAVAVPPHAESNAAPALPRARAAVVRKRYRRVHIWYLT